jgi:hypothetical protein
MRMASRLLFYLCLLVGLTWSCTQAVTIGSDFLDDQKSDLLFADNFKLHFQTLKTDSVITYSPNISYQTITYLLGELHDPVFGPSIAEIYCTPQLATPGTDLIGSTLDSVVLQLKYDTLGLYGDMTDQVTLEVFQMDTTPDILQDYYSNHRFRIKPERLGMVALTPHPRDSFDVAYNGDTIRSAPHIRISLDVSKFADLLLQDTSVFTHQDEFQNYFHGLYVRMTRPANTMLGINLLNALSGLVFYYRTPAEEPRIFKLVFTTAGVNTVYMEHDYTGTPVETALANPEDSSYWYVQGMSGVNASVTIDGLDQIPDAIINQAILEFYASFPPGDDESQYAPCTYLVTQEQTDSTLNYDTDVRIALAIAQGNHFNAVYDLLFGGKRSAPIFGPPTVYKYEMKVTNKVKEILRGNKENILYFNPFSKSDYPNRVVLFGPNDPIYAPRLRVYYTAI